MVGCPGELQRGPPTIPASISVRPASTNTPRTQMHNPAADFLEAEERSESSKHFDVDVVLLGPNNFLLAETRR